MLSYDEQNYPTSDTIIILGRFISEVRTYVIVYKHAWIDVYKIASYMFKMVFVKLNIFS